MSLFFKSGIIDLDTLGNNKRYVKEIAELYHNAVHSISEEYYSLDQLEAWAKTPPDYKSWQKKLEAFPPYVIIKSGKVAAFIDLEKGGKIDCMYTHPSYQRQGLAGTLYRYIEDLARSRNEKILYTYASKVAKEFFLARDFDLVHENQVERNGITLTNYYMVKKLDRATDAL